MIGAAIVLQHPACRAPSPHLFRFMPAGALPRAIGCRVPIPGDPPLPQATQPAPLPSKTGKAVSSRPLLRKDMRKEQGEWRR